jgi:hypothetical protein
MSHRSVLILLAGAAAICALALWLLATDEPAPPGDHAIRKAPSVRDARSPAQVEAPQGQDEVPARASKKGGRARRRAELDRRREAIRERIARRSTDPAGRAEEANPEAVLDKEYIREAVNEGMIPALHDCYDAELEEDPTLEGKVVIRFEILGDEEVGGVVDNVAVVEDQTTLQNEALHECMRESMYALDFPAPDQGGTVTVTYPFMFQPE